MSGAITVAVTLPRISGGSESFDGLNLVILGSLAIACVLSLIVCNRMRRDLEAVRGALFSAPREPRPFCGADALSPEASTAVLFVDGYSMLGLQSLLEIGHVFAGGISQIIFMALRKFDVTDEDRARQAAELKDSLQQSLSHYVSVAHLMDMTASTQVVVGPDVRVLGYEAAVEISKMYPRTTFFRARLHFRPWRWPLRIIEDSDIEFITHRLFHEGFIQMELWFTLRLGKKISLRSPRLSRRSAQLQRDE